MTGVGNFSHIVTDLDKSLEFYHGVLGLELAAPARPFDGNPAIMKLGDTMGAQSRYVQLKVPGSAIGVELIEYKDIYRKPAHPRFQDPGAANLSLRVKDFAGVVDRAKKAGVHVLTAGGGPATVRGSMVMFMQDDDGFVVELGQSATPGGGFEATVIDARRPATPYRAASSSMPTAPSEFNGDKVMTDTAGTPGAQFRQSRAALPGPNGAMASMTFIEFKDIDRKPLRTHVQDPGTAILQLNVRDVDSLMPKLVAAGFTVASTIRERVEFNGTKMVMMRDPNNLYLELIEARAR